MAAGGVAARDRPRADSVGSPSVGLRVGVVVLLLSGLAIWPPAEQVFPMPKAAAGALGATIVLLVGVRRSALPRTISALLAASCGVLVLAAATAPDPVLSFVGRFPRYEGAAVVGAYLLALAAGARAGHDWWRLERTTTAALAVGVGAVVLVAAAQALAPSTGERIGSLLGNATDLGVWCAMVALVLAPVALRGSRTAAAAAVAATGAALWSASRGALLALAVGLVVLLAASWRDRPARRLLLVAGAAVAMLVVLLPEVRGRVLGTDAIASATGTGRWLLWSDTVDLVRAHLPLGVGPSGFVDAIGSAHTARWAAEVGPLDPPDTPHSVILQTASAGGVLLLLVVVALTATVAVVGVRRLRDDARLAGVAAAAAGCLVASLVAFTTPGTTVLLCTLVGVLVSRPSAPGPWLARYGAGIAGVAVSLALVAAVAAESQIRSALDHLGAGDAAAASSAWESAARLRPGDRDLALRWGHAEVAAADAGLVEVGTCLPTTAEAVRLLPTSSEAALDRARCLELSQRYEEALAVLDAAVVHDPVNVDLVLLQGVLASEAGQPDRAVEHLLRAAELRPSAAEPWTDLAIVYRQLGRADLAADAEARARALAVPAP